MGGSSEEGRACTPLACALLCLRLRLARPPPPSQACSLTLPLAPSSPPLLRPGQPLPHPTLPPSSPLPAPQAVQHRRARGAGRGGGHRGAHARGGRRGLAGLPARPAAQQPIVQVGGRVGRGWAPCGSSGMRDDRGRWVPVTSARAGHEQRTICEAPYGALTTGAVHAPAAPPMWSATPALRPHTGAPSAGAGVDCDVTGRLLPWHAPHPVATHALRVQPRPYGCT